MMTAPPAAGRYFERIEFPGDPALPQLPDLLDSELVWQMLQAYLPAAPCDPRRIRIRHFIHNIGRSAIVSYEVEWPVDQYLASEYFVALTARRAPITIYRYPDDYRLPGLLDVARPEAALRCVNEYVLTVPARRARVQLIRYRPAYRAVLRHKIDRLKLYARVVRPSEFDSFLAAYARSAQSGFVVPDLAGCWAAGGVLWLTEVKGENLRSLVRKGRPPDPDRLLNSLEMLWQTPVGHFQGRPFSLKRAYRRALHSFRHNLRDHHDAARGLNAVADSLDPFVRSWRPACLAHNDFYDDQMLVLPDGRVALVDFEEIAPGDPMMDVGNFLAHLHWSSRFARGGGREHCRDYCSALRDAALARFRWDERSLAFREAVCLFRICTNAIRHPKADWQSKLNAGLSLVGECLA